MRAIIKTGPEPGCAYVHDRVEPAVRADEVRIEVAAASVCGTDAAFYRGGGASSDLTMSFPRTMGHEVAGTVVEAGADVAPELALGTRVAVETHLHCGACWFCRTGQGHNCARMDILGVSVDGAFAERLVVPARSCYRLPDEIDLQTAALLESAGSAVHGVLRAGVDIAGSSVLVTGAGPVGLVAAQVVVALGARQVVVTETNPHRRERAAALGLDAVDAGGDPRAAGDASTRLRGGFDLALECSGVLPALTTAVDAVRREGTVVSIGLVKDPLPLDTTETLVSRGLTLRGSWGRSLWTTWDRLTALVVTGGVDLDALISHRLPLSALPEALALMRGDTGKVLLVPSLPDPSASPVPVGAVVQPGEMGT